MRTKILILSTEGEPLSIAFNYLKNHFDIVKVIIEQPMSKRKMISNRIRKLGLFTTIGQLIFIIFSKLIKKLSSKRYLEILANEQLDRNEIPEEFILRVSSVNSSACRNLLKKTPVDLVLLNGTRIIGKKTLTCITTPMVNIHSGITPKYRGVHGGYWSLTQGEKNNCGTTLHYVDMGVDTGEIIAQGLIEVTNRDSYSTYPLLQQKVGLDLLIDYEHFIVNKEKGFSRNDLPSIQWYHPTIVQYLFYFFTKKVK